MLLSFINILPSIDIFSGAFFLIPGLLLFIPGLKILIYELKHDIQEDKKNNNINGGDKY